MENYHFTVYSLPLHKPPKLAKALESQAPGCSIHFPFLTTQKAAFRPATLMVFHIVKVKRVPGEVSTAKEACLKLLHFSCGYCFCLLREPSTRDRSIHGVHFYEFYLLMMANRFFVYSTLQFFFRRGSFLTQLLHLIEVSLESQPVNQ